MSRPFLVSNSLAVAVLLAGCTSPLKPRDADRSSLGPAITSALEREIAQLPAQAVSATVDAGPTDVERTLAARRDELQKIGPQWTAAGSGLDLGPTLDGQSRADVQLGLKTVIQRAVRNNLAVQAARIDESITDSQLARAEAAFDATLFADTSFIRATQPQVGTLLGGGTVLNSVRDTRDWTFTTGLQKPLVTGGTFEVGTSMARSRRFPDGLYSPDPAWATAVNLGYTQPLLRGFGSEVNMAQIHIARNTDRIAFEKLRGQLLQTVEDAETAYWRLAFARQTLVSAEWLVQVGTEVRGILESRRGFDTTPAQYANAVATVEQRKASVLTAQRAVNIANNRLKALINDPDLPVGGEASIVPVDLPFDAVLQQNLRQSIIVAAEKSPEVAQALLLIDTASIGVTVADNGRLPQLDLEGRLAWFGLDSDFGSAYSEISSGDFVEYVIGARFSQSIGNRAAEAAYREARLARSKSVIGYRSAIQNAVLEVKNATQEVVTNHELIRQNRAFRLAQAENLRALLVSEKTLAALTPEFLQLKFQLQDTLSRAEIQMVGSLVEYNVAISSLHRAMGIGLEINQIEINVVDPLAEKNIAAR